MQKKSCVAVAVKKSMKESKSPPSKDAPKYTRNFFTSTAERGGLFTFSSKLNICCKVNWDFLAVEQPRYSHVVIQMLRFLRAAICKSRYIDMGR